MRYSLEAHKGMGTGAIDDRKLKNSQWVVQISNLDPTYYNNSVSKK
jgi:hypothetical protein